MKARILFTLIFCISALASARGASSEETSRWISCYNSDSNQLVFLELGTKVSVEKCSGATVFQGAIGHKLIENVSIDKEQFSENRAGTKKTILLNDGRRLLVSQWSHLGKSNRIIVLEPSLKNKVVKKHCVIENWADAFAARFDKKSNSLKIRVTTPKDKAASAFKKQWKTCAL